MIKTCILLYALIINNLGVGVEPKPVDLLNLSKCINELPSKCLAYSNLLIENFDEDNLYISNAGTNGQFLSKQSGNAGGLTWATPTSQAFAFFMS